MIFYSGSVARNVDPPDGTLVLREALARVPVLPVLRTETAAAAVAAAERLIACGVGVVELTATTPDWAKALHSLVPDHPGVLVGLGTVRDPDTALQAQDEGADFLVSPHLVPDVRAATPLPLSEGGWTPTEVATASRGGIAKLFPAHVGGPAYLRTLRSVLPEAEIVPTGGIEPADVEEWLAAGALAVGLGSALIRQLDEDPVAVTDWLSGLAERVTK